MKSILDPSFVYVPAERTDIRKTFAAVDPSGTSWRRAVPRLDLNDYIIEQYIVGPNYERKQ